MTLTTVVKHRRRRAPRPILGAVSGALFGGFVALDLQQLAIWPLDDLSVFGLPLLGLAAGLALGLTRPLGRRTPPPVVRVILADQQMPPEASPPPEPPA